MVDEGLLAYTEEELVSPTQGHSNSSIVDSGIHQGQSAPLRQVLVGRQRVGYPAVAANLSVWPPNSEVVVISQSIIPSKN